MCCLNFRTMYSRVKKRERGGGWQKLRNEKHLDAYKCGLHNLTFQP